MLPQEPSRGLAGTAPIVFSILSNWKRLVPVCWCRAVPEQATTLQVSNAEAHWLPTDLQDAVNACRDTYPKGAQGLRWCGRSNNV